MVWHPTEPSIRKAERRERVGLRFTGTIIPRFPPHSEREDAWMDVIKNRFRRGVETLVDRLCALVDCELAGQRDQLQQIREDYYAAYVSCAEQDVRQTYFASVEDKCSTIDVVRIQADRAGMTPREWFVVRLSTQWARKAASVTYSFPILNRLLGRQEYKEAERRVRVRLREMYEHGDQTSPGPDTPAAPATGLAALLAWQGSASMQPVQAIAASGFAASEPALEGALFGQPDSSKQNDAVQELQRDLQRALLTHTADELSRLSAGEINIIGVDGETIRRIANGTTRKPRADTQRQLRQTLAKLCTSREEKANPGETKRQTRGK